MKYKITITYTNQSNTVICGASESVVNDIFKQTKRKFKGSYLAICPSNSIMINLDYVIHIECSKEEEK